MPGSVAPARRSRSEYEDEDEEENEISVDGEEPRSSVRKRARLGDDEDDNEDGEDEDEDEDAGEGADDDGEPSSSQDRPLLPDSYRRSPKGKGRADSSRPHQPGSIVRVKLKDFVTYTNAEFNLGPNLNMIIGPNGTGKSTLVCAICLGLGWETKHLGRAKDVSEFVKHGARTATIEIELAKDPARQRSNPVLTTKISREGNKVEYLIDGKKENKKRVVEFARSFSIQVDNLCQFLPQDRVVEFAALSPVELLAQTQRAAAPEYMTEWHQRLKEMRKEQKFKTTEQSEKTDKLKGLENRQRMQQADVDRLRERSDLQQRLASLEKFRPFPAYTVAKEKHRVAKEQRKIAEREWRRLEQQMEPNLQAVNEKDEYHKRIDKSLKLKQRLVERAAKNCDDKNKQFNTAHAELEGISNELQAERNSRKQYTQDMPRLQRNVNEIKKAMENPPEEVDFSAYNEQLRGLTREIRDLENANNEVKEEVDQLKGQRQQHKAIIDQANREKDHLQSQAGQQQQKLYGLSADAAKAWSWIENNRDQFKGEVFGPPILECYPKDMRQAAAVEHVILRELSAFTVTTQEDFKMLQNQLYGTMRLQDINIRQAPDCSLATFQPPVPPQQLASYGLECYVLDLIEGPEEVLAMLCDNRAIHSVAYAKADGGTRQFEELQRSPISAWVTDTTTNQITRRREYGDKATSTRVAAMPAPRWFTDAPIDRQAEESIQSRITEAERDIHSIEERMQELTTMFKAQGEKLKTLRASKKDLSDEKDEKQRARSIFSGLSTRLVEAERKRDDAQQKIAEFQQRCEDIASRGDEIALKKAQYALDCANAIEALRVQHVELFKQEIMGIEAKSDLEQLQARHHDEQAQLAAAEHQVKALDVVEKKLLAEGRQLSAICQAIGVEDLEDAETEVFEEVKTMTPDQLDTELQSTQARLEMTSGGGNANTIADFERRGREIEEERGKLEAIQTGLGELEGSIDEIKSRWEPELDALIAKISEAFAENFAQIQCAGEVGVHKDEDFEDWAIQIKVKFR